jgi:hypothetical protein
MWLVGIFSVTLDVPLFNGVAGVGLVNHNIGYGFLDQCHTPAIFNPHLVQIWSVTMGLKVGMQNQLWVQRVLKLFAELFLLKDAFDFFLSHAVCHGQSPVGYNLHINQCYTNVNNYFAKQP